MAKPARLPSTSKQASTSSGALTGRESARDQRDWVVNETVLSGDLKCNDATGDRSDNSYHVVYASSVTNATLDGVTITAGNADGDAQAKSPDACGGGMHSIDNSLTLRNLVFRGNSATSHGGGMYSKNTSATLTGVQFIDNSAVYGGGYCQWSKRSSAS